MDNPRYPEIQVSFDCADADRVAKFWMVALPGYDWPNPPPDGFATWHEWADASNIAEDQRPLDRTLVDKAGNRPAIFFNQVPEPKPRGWRRPGPPSHDASMNQGGSGSSCTTSKATYSASADLSWRAGVKAPRTGLAPHQAWPGTRPGPVRPVFPFRDRMDRATIAPTAAAGTRCGAGERRQDQ